MRITPTHKEIVNYLRNELGISREYITEVVEKSIANSTKQAIEQRLTDGRLDREVANAVRQVATDSTTSYNKESSRDAFRKAVNTEVKKCLGQILLKDVEIGFTVKPRNQKHVARVVAATLSGEE